MSKCYMCEAEGTTREHVPPLAFFPKPRPSDLVVVPSCKKHNNDNSLDVEYVRNIIVFSVNVNDVGSEVAKAAHRSLRRSPKLRLKILKSAKTIVWRGQETGLVDTEGVRFKRVMRAITHALHYKDFGRTYEHYWMIYHASMLSRFEMDGRRDEISPQIRAALHSIPVADKDTKHPEVFKYAVYQVDEQRIIYKLQFYDGFIVYALGKISDEADDETRLA